ncbi:hypothetical protein Clacol_004655 [Clathrus columnatus]|uniref:Uncharacterized protein n=1 Tax=Clathrus columnatus TaxID=1419009 RepID=A0AAV5AB30_9AGAM|nr:hypothetical protein Clacol_004655 [Clathrus columnatus]
MYLHRQIGAISFSRVGPGPVLLLIELTICRTIQVETFIASLVYPLQQYLHVTHNPYIFILLLVNNVAVIFTDVLVFLAVIHQVWGLLKEKRRLGLHTEKDLVTLLLQQVTQVIISYILPITGAYVTTFQNVLSTILICDFTLDLRRRNTTARSLPNHSALELPDLNLLFRDNPVRSMQAVLGRLQESIIADMGERNGPVGTEGPDQLEREPDPDTA